MGWLGASGPEQLWISGPARTGLDLAGITAWEAYSRAGAWIRSYYRYLQFFLFKYVHLLYDLQTFSRKILNVGDSAIENLRQVLIC